MRRGDNGPEIPVQPVIAIDGQELKLVKTPVIVAAGTSGVWSPAAGKAIRWRGVSITVDPATTTVAGSLVSVSDNTTPIDDLLMLAVGAPGNVPIRFASTLPGNGLLLPVGDSLNITLSAACSTGGIYVNFWGWEE